MDTFQEQAAQKSNEELVAIFVRSQDYQAEFIKVVEEELTKRNIPVSAINQIKTEADAISDQKIEQGVQGNTLYISLCFLSALLGGFISIVAGYIYAFSKRKNSKGESIYYYNEQTRKYGSWMLATGIVMFLVWVYLEL